MKSKLKKTSERTFQDRFGGVVAARVVTELREDVLNGMGKRMSDIEDAYAALLAEDSSAGKAMVAPGDEFDAYRGKDIAVGRAAVKALDKKARALLAFERALGAELDYAEGLLNELLEERLETQDAVDKAAE